MGASKNLFMEDREAELYDNRGMEEIHTFRAYNQISDSFVTKVEEYDNGDISALDAAVDFKKEIEKLELQIEQRKSWIDENKDAVDIEAAKYQNEYGGFKITKQSRETKNFKNIPAWLALEQAKKEFEAKSVAALNMVRKGGLNVDENGEEIPLPEITFSSFIKFDKIKK